MRLIYAGVADFSAAIFSSLIDSPNEVLALISSEDKRISRGKKIQFSSTKKIALAKKIPIIQSNNINQKPVIEQIKRLNPDLLIVCSFGQILSDELLAIAKYGALNIHTSILPKYRGASPIQSAILNGEKQTGISLMKIVSQLDAGPVCAIEKVSIKADETYFSLEQKLIQKTQGLLPTILAKIENQTIEFYPQNEDEVSYCEKIRKSDAKLDFKKSRDEIERMIRAFYPSLVAFCYLNLANNQFHLRIHKAQMVNMELIQSLNLENQIEQNRLITPLPGQLIFNKNRLFVICSELNGHYSFLELLEVQFANKNKIKASELIGSKLIQFKKSLQSKHLDLSKQNLIYLN